MNVMKFILLLIAYCVDSFLVAVIMKEKFSPLLEKKRYYFYIYSGSYLLSILKQLFSFLECNAAITILLSVLLHIYLIFFMIKFYGGKWYKKLLVYGIFNLCALAVEGIVVWGAILGLVTPLDKISEFGTVNILCTSLTKVMLILVVYLVFIKNSKATNNILKGKEILPVLLFVIVLHIPTIAIFDRPGVFKKSGFIISYFMLVQIILVILVCYIFYLIQVSKMEMRVVEKKLESAEEVIRLTTSLRDLKHDMSFHVNILLDMAYKGEKDDMIHYMEHTFECIKIINDTFQLQDQAIASSLNLIAQRTKEKHIEFKHIIMVDDFVLPSHEMCSLLTNILSNAMDAAEKVKQKKRIICLEISPTEGGYYINCMNTYRNRPIFNQGKIVTSKADEESHGRGIWIIKNIVEKHGGAMNIMLHDDTKVFEMYCFIPNLVQGEMLHEK